MHSRKITQNTVFGMNWASEVEDAFRQLGEGGRKSSGCDGEYYETLKWFMRFN